MTTRNISKDLEVLRSLLPKLRSGEINVIEFGDPAMPLGPLSHHRIKNIPTHGGMQICFKFVSRRMEGSGDYIGDATDREIEIKAQSRLESYFKPTQFSEMLKKFDRKPSDALTYFGLKEEE